MGFAFCFLVAAGACGQGPGASTTSYIALQVRSGGNAGLTSRAQRSPMKVKRRGLPLAAFVFWAQRSPSQVWRHAERLAALVFEAQRSPSWVQGPGGPGQAAIVSGHRSPSRVQRQGQPLEEKLPSALHFCSQQVPSLRGPEASATSLSL